VLKSIDGGKTWIPTTLTQQEFSLFSYVYALVINPQTPETIYAGTTGNGVFKSIDGGANWTPINTGIPGVNFLAFISIFAIAINPLVPETLYAGMVGERSGPGLFKSLDGGEHWTLAVTGIDTGLPNTFAYALAIDPEAPDAPYERVDLTGVDPEAVMDAIREHATRAQASLDLERGPLLRVMEFQAGGGQPNRLLILMHHLVVDGVSWRILIEDMYLAGRQARAGEPIQPGRKTTSFQHWARRLREYSNTTEAREELAFWRENRPAVPVPVDFREEPGTVETESQGTVELNATETDILLRQAPQAHRTQINDVLLTALVEALGKWTGKRSALIHLEGHGREGLFEDVDLSRTVGWFTTMFPVYLDLEGAGVGGEALQSVKRQLRRVPRRGIGYGLLRYVCEDEAVRRELSAGPVPQIAFNYFGQFDRLLERQLPGGKVQEACGPSQSPAGRRAHLIEINGMIVGGALRMAFSFSREAHRTATIEEFAANYIGELRSLIAHCEAPVEYPLAGLNDAELDEVLSQISAKEFA